MSARKRKLTCFVSVVDQTKGEHVFGPDDDVPAWAQKEITNPDVWDDGDADDDSDEASAPKATRSRTSSRSSSKAKTAPDSKTVTPEDEAAVQQWLDAESAWKAEQGESGDGSIKPGEAFDAETGSSEHDSED